MIYDVIVIGGGPAGIMAAIESARVGATTLLLEKNIKLGKKLAITGKGRCNVTNAGEMRDIIRNLTGNGSFMYSSLSQFDNDAVVNFFETNGLPLKVERGKRVFPQSDKAGDVVDVLVRELKKVGARVHYEETVLSLTKTENFAIKTNKSTYEAKSVVIATGGVTYPGTGSTGDGYAWASGFEHQIIKPRPSLVPLTVKEKWVKDLSGLPLKNVNVKITDKEGNVIDEAFGEMLFAHFGITGPVVLSLSRKACDYWQENPNTNLFGSINLKPALSAEQLDTRVIRDFNKFIRKQFQNALGELLPKSLIPVVIELSGIPAEFPVNQISKEQRQSLVELLQNLSFTIVGARPISEAIVTAGGINTKEINPKTMESKKVANLFFAGEVIDVDGYTGGYNLQVAFSSGFVAGVNAATNVLS